MLTYELEQSQKRQRDLYVDLDTRMRKMEGAPGPPAAAADRPDAAAAPVQAPRARSTAAAPRRSIRPDGAEQRAYDAALDQFKRGDYQRRHRAASPRFVKTYPKSALAPSAQYWSATRSSRARTIARRSRRSGSCSSLAGQRQGAGRAAQHRVRAVGMGDNAAARRTLEELIGKYPQSDAATRRSSASAADAHAVRARSALLTECGVVPAFAARVVAWQRAHGRHDLPWQDTRDAYRIWLSEVMLQQTQVATVLPYYTRFVCEFPDVARSPPRRIERVLEHWSGLGYYRRAHHLHAAARAVVDRPWRRVSRAMRRRWRRCRASAARPRRPSPRSRAARAAPILDGNVKRVLARHRGIEGCPGAAKVEAQLWGSRRVVAARAATSRRIRRR